MARVHDRFIGQSIHDLPNALLQHLITTIVKIRPTNTFTEEYITRDDEALTCMIKPDTARGMTGHEQHIKPVGTQHDRFSRRQKMQGPFVVIKRHVPHQPAGGCQGQHTFLQRVQMEFQSVCLMHVSIAEDVIEMTMGIEQQNRL